MFYWLVTHTQVFLTKFGTRGNNKFNNIYAKTVVHDTFLQISNNFKHLSQCGSNGYVLMPP